MRPIHLARLDKTRPVLVLTRERVRPSMTSVTIAPITSTIMRLGSEVPVGRGNGLEGDSVVSCDNIRTIRVERLGRHIGYLRDDQEGLLAAAIVSAFDLRVEELD